MEAAYAGQFGYKRPWSSKKQCFTWGPREDRPANAEPDGEVASCLWLLGHSRARLDDTIPSKEQDTMSSESQKTRLYLVQPQLASVLNPLFAVVGSVPLPMGASVLAICFSRNHQQRAITS